MAQLTQKQIAAIEAHARRAAQAILDALNLIKDIKRG